MARRIIRAPKYFFDQNTNLVIYFLLYRYLVLTLASASGEKHTFKTYGSLKAQQSPAACKTCPMQSQQQTEI